MAEMDLLFLHVQRTELADVLRGDRRKDAIPLRISLFPRMGGREATVFWTQYSRRPCAIAVRDDDRDELFSWANSYHRDLSPLTSWCHVLSPREVENLVNVRRLNADLSGLEAAWAGASIAEAMILAKRGYETITLPSCLATDTFAIGRSAALYGARGGAIETTDRLDRVREKLTKSQERWRPASSFVIGVLMRLLPDPQPTTSWLQEQLLRACGIMRSQSTEGREVPSRLVLEEISRALPQPSPVDHLDELSAEQRVRLLREMPAWLGSVKQDDVRHLIFFTAGYVISRIGAAERDLRLAEIFENGYPNVLTWAAVIGSLGASTYWSDAFGGIGRLVARELSRSFDLTDAPNSDISADEFLAIAGADRGAPKFRTALRQIASISLRPGVVSQLSTFDEDRDSRAMEVSRAPTDAGRSLRDTPEQRHLHNLAEQLFPYIRELLLRSGFEPSRDRKASRKGRPPQLPLK